MTLFKQLEERWGYFAYAETLGQVGKLDVYCLEISAALNYLKNPTGKDNA